MPVRHPSRTIRQCLDSMGHEEFKAFAKMIISPPQGVKVKRATPEELKEIKERLERLK